MEDQICMDLINEVNNEITANFFLKIIMLYGDLNGLENFEIFSYYFC